MMDGPNGAGGRKGMVAHSVQPSAPFTFPERKDPMLKNAVTVAAVFLAAFALVGAKGCSSHDCEKARTVVAAACAANESSTECITARALAKEACPTEPTPPPPATCADGLPPGPDGCPKTCADLACPYGCTESPDKSKSATCNKPPEEPPVDPPPATDEVEAACGLKMPEGASAKVNTSGYGQGVDTSLYVLDWPDLCTKIHGNPVNPNSCHLEGHTNRQACEIAVMKRVGGAACPIFRFRTAAHPDGEACLQIDPYETGGMSCDHFGNTEVRDDPITAPFEGLPAECGAQRDSAGHPMAGYFAIAHGDGEVQACLPNGSGCGRWTRVIH